MKSDRCSDVLARELLILVGDDELINLQLFIEEKRSTSIESLGARSGVPREEMERAWNFQLYGIWVRRFILQQSLVHRKLEHKIVNGNSIALLPSNAIEDPAIQTTATNLNAKMQAHNIINFDEALWGRWSQIEPSLPYIKEVPVTVFDSFLVREYYNTMQTVLAKAAKQVSFVPRVAPEINASLEEVEKRRELLGQLCSEDATFAEESIAEKWRCVHESSDVVVRSLLPKDPPQAFW